MPDTNKPLLEKDLYEKTLAKGNKGVYNRAGWISINPKEIELAIHEALTQGWNNYALSHPIEIPSQSFEKWFKERYKHSGFIKWIKTIPYSNEIREAHFTFNNMRECFDAGQATSLGKTLHREKLDDKDVPEWIKNNSLLQIDKWMPYEDLISRYYYETLLNYIKSSPRKPPVNAFTSGLGRNIAFLIDEAFNQATHQERERIRTSLKELLSRIKDIQPNGRDIPISTKGKEFYNSGYSDSKMQASYKLEVWLSKLDEQPLEKID